MRQRRNDTNNQCIQCVSEIRVLAIFCRILTRQFVVDVVDEMQIIKFPNSLQRFVSYSELPSKYSDIHFLYRLTLYKYGQDFCDIHYTLFLSLIARLGVEVTEKHVVFIGRIIFHLLAVAKFNTHQTAQFDSFSLGKNNNHAVSFHDSAMHLTHLIFHQ